MPRRNLVIRVPQAVIDAGLNWLLNWQGPIFRGLRLCVRLSPALPETPSPTPTSIEGREAPPQLYATRVVGREVWKAEALLTEAGVSIGYVQRRRRVSLGLAMGTVKDDDPVIEWISQEDDS